MKIYVDNREKEDANNDNVIEKFKKFVANGKCEFITEVETGSYKSGDVHSGDGLIGIERKRDDFLPSVWRGLLDKQLRELKDNFEHPFLFIEYDGIKDLIKNCLGVNPKVVIGELTSIMARHQVTIMFVGDLYIPFCIRTIEKFYDGKNETKHISYTPIRRGVTIKETKLDIISRLPKIGPKKGYRLLEHFDNSIGNISKASVEELEQIPGIGRKLAEEIKEVLK